MKKNIFNKLLVACCLLSIISCKARKQVIVARKADTAKAVDNKLISKLVAIKAQQVNFSSFAAKAKTNLDINGNSNDVT
jgi:hypothetical protein